MILIHCIQIFIGELSLLWLPKHHIILHLCHIIPETTLHPCLTLICDPHV